MLITRPNHDVTTNYLFFWSQNILREAHKKGIKTIDLQGKRANPREFTQVIQKTHPTFIVINGHGDADTVTGYDNETLVVVGKNESLFAGRIVYARSCSSAKRLGPACIVKGGKTYIGYREDFVFIIDESYVTHPLDDETARLFLEPANLVVTALIKGHSAKDANSRSKQLFKHEIEKLLTSETPAEDQELIPYLHWNMTHQVCLGDGDARLS